MAPSTEHSAITQIEKYGALIVFPIKTNLDVPSLWKCFHPRTTMRWDWSDDGSDRVAELWHLRERLSRCRKVVYVKWFQGRATFFSLEVFTALLSCFASLPDPLNGLDDGARRVYRALLDDSPLPTKELRESSGFSGREREAEFQRAIKALWRRLLIVGYGEVEEGGFPSLAVGCSRHLFEVQWDRAKVMDESERERILQRTFPVGSPFLKAYRRMQKLLPSS
jgi:hypothetical protein